MLDIDLASLAKFCVELTWYMLGLLIAFVVSRR